MQLIDNVKQYPRSVYFILVSELAERFSFYGMKALLTVYLLVQHNFSESTSTLFFHAFTCLAYISPLVGSVLADSYYGRYSVIVYVSVIYVGGHVLLSIGSIPEWSHVFGSVLDFGGLILISLATGGIKPCVSAFAVDQFDENQKKLRSQFFSFYYFAINTGALLAILLTPMLKTRVSCLGSDHCFPLAFGIPGIAMAVALLVFIAGSPFYRKFPPKKENVAWEALGCLCEGICSKIRGEKKADWLGGSYPPETVQGVRSLLGIINIFYPLIFFWTLFDQTGSTWVHQARRTDGRIGGMAVLPEQMTLLNPLLVLTLVPIMEAFIYPAVNEMVELTSLRKMSLGGLLTGFSFVLAGCLQLFMDRSAFVVDGGQILIQTMGQSISLRDSHGQAYAIDGKRRFLPSGIYEGDGVPLLNMTDSGRGFVVEAGSIAAIPLVKAPPSHARVFFLLNNQSIGGNVFVLDNSGSVLASSVLSNGVSVDVRQPFIVSSQQKIAFGPNCLGIDCPFMVPINVQVGAVHILHVNGVNSTLLEMVAPYRVSILWLIPQYISISLGEVLMSVSALDFAYSQAAPHMKSVVQAMWLLTVFAGNLVAAFVSGSHVLSPSVEFFAYALSMFVVMSLFIFHAIHYEYVDEDKHMKTIVDDGSALPRGGSSTFPLSVKAAA